VGNPQGDFFFFDLGSGSLANFNGLHLPVTDTTKVFLTHLHADHVGDVPTLVWSMAKGGRRDPVELWGPGGDRPELGTRAYAEHLEAAVISLLRLNVNMLLTIGGDDTPTGRTIRAIRRCREWQDGREQRHFSQGGLATPSKWPQRPISR